MVYVSFIYEFKAKVIDYTDIGSSIFMFIDRNRVLYVFS